MPPVITCDAQLPPLFQVLNNLTANGTGRRSEWQSPPHVNGSLLADFMLMEILDEKIREDFLGEYRFY